MPATPLTTPVAVLPAKFMAAAADLSDEVQPMVTSTLYECMAQDWASDAHFCCYRPTDNLNAPEWPRLKKIILPKIRAMGGDVLCTCFGFDYDNPGHLRWTGPEQVDQWLDLFAGVIEKFPLAGDFTYLYQTRGGMRLVYLLAEPLPVDKAEDKHRWMTEQFRQHGLLVDELSDWTRVFRLPYVLRDDQPTRAENPLMIVQEEKNIDAASLPGLAPKNLRLGENIGEVFAVEDERPSDEEATNLVFADGVKASKLTDWAKHAKRRMTGRECSDAIFNNASLNVPPGRDSTLHKYVGQAIGLLLGQIEGTTPAHVYALFLPSVQQLEPDAQTPDWTRTLWDKVCRLWAQQDAKERALRHEIEVEQAKEAEVQKSLLERILTGMRQWCSNPILHDTSDNNRAAIAWAARRFIVTVGNSYFVIGADGRYMAKPLASHQLIPFIRCLGLDSVIDTSGEEGDMLTREIVNRHSTVAHDIWITCDQTPGGTIDNMDEPTAVVRLSGFLRRRDLEPRFDRWVDQWLRHLFGTDYALAERWLAWVPAVEEGSIAAMSIRSEQGTGKNMLGMAVAECFESGLSADAEDLTSAYQYGLLKSPVLWVDEGFPNELKGKGAYHAFRSLITGKPRRANTKNQHPVEIRCPYRLLFTANNDNIVESLVGAANLSAEDREALAIRLIHLNCSNKATIWLREMGGYDMTGKKGHRWVAGEGGEPSDFVVARHILWLHENRIRFGPRGKRLLVEGASGTDIMFKLRTRSGAAPLVIETILKMLDNVPMPAEITVEDNRLFVLGHGVVEFFRRYMSQYVRESVTDVMVGSVLKGLSVTSDLTPKVLRTRQQLGRRRWSEIDVEVMLQALDETGGGSLKLSSLAQARKDSRPYEQVVVEMTEATKSIKNVSGHVVAPVTPPKSAPGTFSGVRA